MPSRRRAQSQIIPQALRRFFINRFAEAVGLALLAATVFLLLANNECSDYFLVTLLPQPYQKSFENF